MAGFIAQLMPQGMGDRLAALAHGGEPLLPRVQQGFADQALLSANADALAHVFSRDPGDPAMADTVDPREVLREMWGEDDEDDEYLTEQRHPFASAFPGLAPPASASLPQEPILGALDAFEAAHVGLVAARRPADIVTVAGWGPTDAWQELQPLTAVLRSLEDRFGARLLQVGPGAEIRLLVQRPPRSLDEALPVAAELWAFSDDWFDEAGNERSGIRQVSEIAPRLVNAPLWGIWWD
jgi:hypothetical protein